MNSDVECLTNLDPVWDPEEAKETFVLLLHMFGIKEDKNTK